ncbi:unnamed protein product, partial [Staurois parvus]
PSPVLTTGSSLTILLPDPLYCAVRELLNPACDLDHSLPAPLYLAARTLLTWPV